MFLNKCYVGYSIYCIIHVLTQFSTNLRVNFKMNNVSLLEQICTSNKHVLVHYNKNLSDILYIYVRGTSTYNFGFGFYKCSWFILHSLNMTFVCFYVHYQTNSCVPFNLLTVNFILVCDSVLVMNKTGGP